MSTVTDRIRTLLSEHLGTPESKITTTSMLIDDLGCDSLDTIELAMAIEEEFGIEIPDDAAESIVTVGDAVKFSEKAQS